MRATLHFLSTQYILLTIGTTLHGRSLDLFLSSNCNFMPAEPQSPFSTSLTQWQPPLCFTAMGFDYFILKLHRSTRLVASWSGFSETCLRAWPTLAASGYLVENKKIL